MPLNVLIATNDVTLSNEIANVLNQSKIKYRIIPPSLGFKYCAVSQYTHLICGTSRPSGSQYTIHPDFLKRDIPSLYIGDAMLYYMSNFSSNNHESIEDAANSYSIENGTIASFSIRNVTCIKNLGSHSFPGVLKTFIGL